jgi:2-dehydro-3-deoxygalactonokinase
MERATTLVGVDWGTSSFRAYRIGSSGIVQDRKDADCGIRSVPAGGFGAVLAEQIGAWTGGEHSVPILMSGMIGSRQGWQEADYCPIPASADDIASRIARVDGQAGSVSIVPGVVAGDVVTQVDAMPDVMRGEETQIFGALQQLGRSDGLFVLPGTHSKWVTVGGHTIRHFATYMTGEIFAALSGHTILGSLMKNNDGVHHDGFTRGLDDGHRAGAPGALLHRLFGVRTHALFGNLPPEAVADYLSGLLIGAEFADAAGQSDTPLCVLGAPDLAERYIVAADRFGLRAERIDPECTAAGLFALACRAGLVTPAQDGK